MEYSTPPRVQERGAEGNANRRIDKIIGATLAYAQGNPENGELALRSETVQLTPQQRAEYAQLYSTNPEGVREINKRILQQFPREDDFQTMAGEVAHNPGALRLINTIFHNLHGHSSESFQTILANNLALLSSEKIYPTVLDFDDAIGSFMADADNRIPVQGGMTTRQLLENGSSVLRNVLYAPLHRDYADLMKRVAALDPNAQPQPPSQERLRSQTIKVVSEPLVSPKGTEGLPVDIVWYTWSEYGLGSMPMGYRVRAASGELRDTQSMRYRQIDRFLRYELPKGIPINELYPENAPLTLRFNRSQSQTDTVLVRSAFKGRDLAGRNSVYSTVLRAFPRRVDIGPREAIALLRDRTQWEKSEEHIASRDTTLPQDTLGKVVSEYSGKQQINMATLEQYLPPVIDAFLQRPNAKIILAAPQCEELGYNMASDLIWGLTHALSRDQIKDLTFSTYERQDSIDLTEKNPQIVGTVGVEPVQAMKMEPGYGIPSEITRKATIIDCYQPPPEHSSQEARDITKRLLQNMLARNA